MTTFAHSQAKSLILGNWAGSQSGLMPYKVVLGEDLNALTQKIAETRYIVHKSGAETRFKERTMLGIR